MKRLALGASALLTLTGLGLATLPASAKPAHLKALAEYYGPFMPAALNNCSTCHNPSTTGKPPLTLADFPHNAFGKRLMDARAQLQASGKGTDLNARIRAVANDDSDGDGVPNQIEILTSHHPGDPKDKPTAAELGAVKTRMPRVAAFLNAYRWRPFDPVARPVVPKVKEAAWVRNPIDAFVAAERETRGLRPRPEASREVLLRRVYLDLIGLSPTPDELHAFLADKSPNAYDKVVDRLLSSPQYGERWGRHWMDVWRYSDWAGWGDQVRDSQPHIWHWRDWIVDSLNRDKGYDRMIVEMLAADEAYPLDQDALRGTGFLVRNFKLLSREKWMEDTVDHTGEAFLGLTVGCARCHDHMFDPISQKEYYRLRAVFEPHYVRMDWVPGQLDTAKDGLPRVVDSKPDDPTYLFTRGDERQPVKDDPLKPGVLEALGGTYAPQPVALPVLARFPEKQPYVVAALKSQAEGRVVDARNAVAGAASDEQKEASRLKLAAAEAGQAALEAVLRVEQIEDDGKESSDEWKAAAEATVQAQRHQAAADAALKRFQAEQAVREGEKSGKMDALQQAKKTLAEAETAVTAADAALKAPVTTDYKPRVTSSFPPTSTGRRLALAKWIANSQNPLTARVAMNQIWMRHFGQGIVPTVSDFGRNGAPPTHPQLLDWLASEFMARGWSMKAMHRLIVTSATYRMASTPDAADLAKDPDNKYLWRMNTRRMDAEIVRDNVLWTAGQLDLTMGGPDIDQNLGLSVKRRTIYFRHAAEKEMVFTTIFDGPSVVECYRRKETIVPQQALALANSEVTLVQSRLLARSLAQTAGADATKFVTSAYERVLARSARPAEVAECVKFLDAQAKQLAAKPAASAATDPGDGSKPSADPALRAREDLVMVLMNHNDFVSIR